ncbi:hypothetical protein C348_06815 [Cryptococcus neoformans Gb118]|nr:hypothetical protein C360_07035 [Cryptococcus neoformans var. grubii Bt15]OXL05124.1 hypothetical protein C348_06815 [Cryptococcus neoformans var. grubii Gb118]
MSHYDEGYDYGFGDDEGYDYGFSDDKDPAIPQDSSPLRRSLRNRAGPSMVCTNRGQLSTLPGGEDAIDFRPQLAQNSGYKTLTKERQRQVSDFATPGPYAHVRRMIDIYVLLHQEMQTRVASDKCSVAKYANAVVTLSMLPSYRHATLYKVVIDPMERFEPGIIPQNDSSATEEIERWVKSLLTHLRSDIHILLKDSIHDKQNLWIVAEDFPPDGFSQASSGDRSPPRSW